MRATPAKAVQRPVNRYPRCSPTATRVIAVEVAVIITFFFEAATAVSVTPWILVAIYLAHGAKDLWRHRTRLSPWHSLVAAVLLRRRHGRRRDHRRPDPPRRPVPRLGAAATAIASIP